MEEEGGRRERERGRNGEGSEGGNEREREVCGCIIDWLNLLYLMVTSNTCTVVQGPLKDMLSSTSVTARINSLRFPITWRELIIILIGAIVPSLKRRCIVPLPQNPMPFIRLLIRQWFKRKKLTIYPCRNIYAMLQPS